MRFNYLIIFSFLFILFFLIFLPRCKQTLAEDVLQPDATVSAFLPALKAESINPTNPTGYSLKRLKENIILQIYSFFPDKKIDYFQQILDSRLAELKSLTDQKDVAYIEKATKRYAATAGNYMTYLISQGKKDKAKPIIEEFSQHILFLKQMQPKYGYDSSPWRFLEDDINYLKLYSKELQYFLQK